ncbi:putative FmdB family regulatory protein [Actinocorallia herbida]|uniref:Putative FmdB family regulatory protein n=1 Tax=Actinocorallia herbida TaxID=58109 RepID=A0A3N1DDR4_9ACTN|nr:FmdB family zinc ribbon protein [Actinocorallia herbida]ROO91318.1 putative FmdB family regulatory protein [Actinocorallia herbida]
MPTYQYACADCGEGLEVVQKFSDDALTECPNCGGNLRKVFSAVGIVFKGSGFYRNDSRGSGKSTTPATTSAEKKTETKTESSAPAKAESSSSTPSTSSSSSASSTPSA